tara:strand:- start:104 stop:604 length:501 start_codon:yes stop_codon:yes gene_type:complete
MSKNIEKSILINNLEILELSRVHQVNQFLDRDPELFNSILDSNISVVIGKLSQEKIRLFWLDYLWLIALNRIDLEGDINVKKLKTDSFMQIYKTYISELKNPSEDSVLTDFYTKTLNKKQDIINSLINTGLKSEFKLNTLKLDIRINSNQFNKIIANEKNGNNRNV